jgi:hypothetical protein
MALAWIRPTLANGAPAFEVESGCNKFYEIFLVTRPQRFPELLPGEIVYSSRSQQGLLPTAGGRALFPLPQILRERVGPQNLCLVVKTYRDDRGNGPAVSPLFTSDGTQVILPPADPVREGSMPSFDREALLAQLSNGSGNGGAHRHPPYVAAAPMVRAHGAAPRPGPTRRKFKANGQATIVRADARRPRPRERTVPRVAAGSHQQPLATGLALVCDGVRQLCAEDPKIPGKPSREETIRLFTHVLSHIPSANGQGTAAQALYAQMTGVVRHPDAGRALEQMLGRAVPPRSREQFLQAIASVLGPVVQQVLPQLLPVLLNALGPVLQNLIGRLGQSQGLEARRAREQFFPAIFAALGPVLSNVLPAILPMLTGLLGNLVGGKSLSAPAAPGQPAAPAPAPPPAVPVQTPGAHAAVAAPAVPGAAPGANAVAPNAGAAVAGLLQSIPPDQMAALLGGSGAAGAAGGGGPAGALPMPASVSGMIGQFVSSPEGSAAIGDLVRRIPIEDMLTGYMWKPTIDHNAFISTLPWEKVLSLSDATGAIGTLAVPGRKGLKRLEGVRAAIVDRATLPLDDGSNSWVFVADRPGRLKLEVAAGGQGLDNPFVDVRVSVDGRAETGLERSVFRLTSLGAGEVRHVYIEIPPATLQRAPTDGRPTCVSVRVITKKSERQYYAVETRAMFYVVQPETLVLASDGVLRDTPELTSLRGLASDVPPAALTPDLRSVDWSLSVVPSAPTNGYGRALPLTLARANGDLSLVGGIEFSAIGLADLACRLSENDLSAERLKALEAALNRADGLRSRLALRVRELIPAQPSAGGSIAVRTEMGALEAFLVSFTSVGPDGNPTRREVTRLRLPVPRGINLEPSAA